MIKDKRVTIEEVQGLYFQCYDSNGVPVILLYDKPTDVWIAHEEKRPDSLKVTISFKCEDKDVSIGNGLVTMDLDNMMSATKPHEVRSGMPVVILSEAEAANEAAYKIMIQGKRKVPATVYTDGGEWVIVVSDETKGEESHAE